MNLSSGAKIPMLVVMQDVDSVGAALEQATCQVCLGRQGPTDRGLYEVLKGLGLQDGKDEMPSSRQVIVAPEPDRSAGIDVAVVIASRPPREVMIFDPLMGTSIGVSNAHSAEPSQGSRRDAQTPRPETFRESKLPRDRRPPRRLVPETPIEHLTGPLSARAENWFVLQIAAVSIRARDEGRERARVQEFNKAYVPNRPSLTDGDGPRPRIVYPQGGEYGPDFQVQHSLREAWCEEFCLTFAKDFFRWLGEKHEELGIGAKLGRINTRELLKAYLTTT